MHSWDCTLIFFPRNRIPKLTFFNLPSYFNCSTVLWPATLFPTGNMLLFLSLILKMSIFSPLAAYLVCLSSFPASHVCFVPVSTELMDPCAYHFHPIWKISAHSSPFFTLNVIISQSIFSACYPASGSVRVRPQFSMAHFSPVFWAVSSTVFQFTNLFLYNIQSVINYIKYIFISDTVVFNFRSMI